MSFSFVRTPSGVTGYLQTKYLVSAPQHSVGPSSPASCTFSHNSSHVSPQLAHSTSGPSLQKICNRVLAVDREQNSFVPIIGIDKAADMTIDDALRHALRGCSKLQSCLCDEDIQVRRPVVADTLTRTLFIAHDSSFCQAIASAARLHSLRLSSPDPFGLSEHHAASIHASAPRLTLVAARWNLDTVLSRRYTQETHFYHTLNELLRGGDRAKLEPYKPYANNNAPLTQRDRFPLASTDT
jgi:hypothetical protein